MWIRRVTSDGNALHLSATAQHNGRRAGYRELPNAKYISNARVCLVVCGKKGDVLGLGLGLLGLGFGLGLGLGIWLMLHCISAVGASARPEADIQLHRPTLASLKQSFLASERLS